MNSALSFGYLFRKEALPFGWAGAKKNIRFFVKVFIIVLLIGLVTNIVYAPFQNHGVHVGSTIAFLLEFIINSIIAFGMIRIYLAFAMEQTPHVPDLRNHDYGRFVQWLSAKILVAVFVILGLILLIIPGIIIGSRLYFYSYFVIDKKMNARDAINASRELTRGHVREIIGIGVLSFLITLLGAIALGIGLLRAVPTVELARAYLYKKLVHQHDEHHSSHSAHQHVGA